MSEVYDVVIVGGGPAGLTAGIYTARDRLKSVLLEKAMCGGLPASTEKVENYPGFPEGVGGQELMNRMKRQAENFGLEIREFSEVKSLESKGGVFEVVTDRGSIVSKTVIVASGSVPKKLGVPGEEKFFGKGVSYCATCDGPFYKDKDVAVIGCGNSGLQEGEALLKFVKSITFVEFLPYMKAEKILQERIKKHDNVVFYLNHELKSINGGDYVKSITVKDRDSGEEKEIHVEGVFVYIGFLPNSSFVRGLVELDEWGYVITDENMRTSVEGIWAVGDVRSKKYRQIVEACGEGVIAAMSISEYLKEKGAI